MGLNIIIYSFNIIISDTLLKANKETLNVPTDKIQDKVSFIFNNLSQMNMTQKKEGNFTKKGYIFKYKLEKYIF